MNRYIKNIKSSFNLDGNTIRSVTIAFSLMLLVFLAVSAFSFFGARQVEGKYKTVITDAMLKLELVNKLYKNEDAIYSNVLGHLSTTSPEIKKHYEEQIATVNKDNLKTLQQLRLQLKNDGLLVILNEFERDRQRYTNFIRSHLSQSRHRKTTTKAELISAYTSTYVNSTHKRLLSQLNDGIRESAREKGDKAIDSVTSTIDNFNLLLLFAFLLALASGFLLQNIVKRLRRDNLLLNAEIQDRQQLEVALTESQRQYKNLFNYNPVPLWVYDLRDESFVDVNQAAINEYGYSREEFLSLKLSDIIAPEVPASADVTEQPAEVGSLANMSRHKRKDNSVFAVETIVHNLPASKEIHPGIVVAINVDDRERALSQLKHNEKLLREVSSSIPGAVFQFQLDSQYTPSFMFISEGIKSLYGLSPAEVQANPPVMYEHIHPEDLAKVKEHVKVSLTELTPLEVEYRIWFPEQQLCKWIRVHGLPTQKQDVVTWNGTFIDITKQKVAQEQLVSSEANLRALLNSSPQAIYLLDADMKVLLFNKVAVEEVSRYLFKELTIGQSITDFIDEAAMDKIVANHAVAMQGGTVVYETGQGNLWYEVAFRPITGPDNTVLAVAFSTLDISEQKHTLETIKRSERQLARAQELAHLGNWEYDLERNEMTWSDGVFAIYELNKDSFKPTFHNKIAFAHPDERKRVRTKLENAIQTHQLFTDEYRILLSNGNERVVYEIVETLYDEEGNATKISGAVQDITERKQTEREVTEAKNLLQSTLENIPEVIFSTDTRFRINYISPQCQELTGYTEPDFYKKPSLWSKLIHPDDRRMLLEQLMVNLVAGQRQQCEIRITTRDGSQKWLLFRLSPLVNDEGEVVRIDGSASDMTQYKLAEEKRTQLTEELLRQNQNLQQFAYIVSHNLRAPIANILGLTSIYDRTEHNPAKNIRVIDSLEKSTRLLDTTIRDLNDILTVRSDISSLHEEVYFSQALEQIKDSLAGEIEKTGAEIMYEFHEAPSIMTIKSYIHSIVLNLVTNAIKYRSTDRNLSIQVKSFRLPNYICLSISDNGLGIDLSRFKDKIFGLYKRFHTTVDGKGIGLHLVKTQAELLGGRVEVESQVGVGTTFIIYLKS